MLGISWIAKRSIQLTNEQELEVETALMVFVHWANYCSCGWWEDKVRMWGQQPQKLLRLKRINNFEINIIRKVQLQPIKSAHKENIYMCFTLLKLANVGGIGPDSWFSSTWILFKLDRLPSSSGKEPVNWFPLKSLKTEIGNKNFIKI